MSVASDRAAICLNCGSGMLDTPVVVTSALGVWVWNQLNPDDPRTELILCSETCCYRLGVKHGQMIRRLEGSPPSSSETG